MPALQGGGARTCGRPGPSNTGSHVSTSFSATEPSRLHLQQSNSCDSHLALNTNKETRRLPRKQLSPILPIRSTSSEVATTQLHRLQHQQDITGSCHGKSSSCNGEGSSSAVTLDSPHNTKSTEESIRDEEFDQYAQYITTAAWDSSSDAEEAALPSSLDAPRPKFPAATASRQENSNIVASQTAPVRDNLGDKEENALQLTSTQGAQSRLQPWDATAGPSSLRAPRRPEPADSEEVAMPIGDRKTDSVAAKEFLSAENSPSSRRRDLPDVDDQNATPRRKGKELSGGINTSEHAKSKEKGRRAEVPVIELQVQPTSDTVNMFGSTQTSSNYSLSGKIVVRLRNHIGEDRELSLLQKQSGSGPRRDCCEEDRIASSLRGDRQFRLNPWLPEIRSEGRFLDAEDFMKTRFDSDQQTEASVDNLRRAEEISVQSLEISFTGYGLYVDHSGRFAACKLIEVSEEVLPHGSVIPVPILGSTQEYEIEFTLSLPGWLPASLASRFGGTFYSLEAKAKYAPMESEQEPYAIPSSLLPPRRGSRALAVDACEGRSAYEGEEARDGFWNDEAQRSSGEVPSRASFSLRTPRSRAESLPPSAKEESSAKDKENWISKRAKRLSVLGKIGASVHTSPSGSGTASPINASASSMSNSPSLTPSVSRKLHPSRGFIKAFSDPVVVVIRRCREVVPVPVTRMAFIGSEGTPHDITQDPPASSVTAPVDVHTGSAERSTRFSGHAEAPRDPAKLLAHAEAAGMPSAPQRSSSVPTDLSLLRENERYTPDGSALRGGAHDSNSSIPMRHFLHRPLLHPPSDAGIGSGDRGLPFSLTLSIPSHVAVAGPGSDVLDFAIQIEVGSSPFWTDVRQMGGLRLREMELSCVQTERHCSVASRSFCHSFPLPPDCNIGPYDLPLFNQKPKPVKAGRTFTSSEQRLRRGYDLELVNRHVELIRSGNAPSLSENNVERVRTAVVGPPPHQPSLSASSTTQHLAAGAMNGAQSQSFETRESSAREEASSDRRGVNSNRGRRAYQSALRGLSNFATAVMDISLDSDTPVQSQAAGWIPGVSRPDLGSSTANRIAAKSKKDAEKERTALYAFSGSDGHGVDLTRGRVRMAIKLPMVASDPSRARATNSPALSPDFEGPYAKIRHKLQVKLSFGFGDKPLGGEGTWGQSLMMCVPVRFTDAAPKEIREQFAPRPIRQVTVPTLSAGHGVNASAVEVLDATSMTALESAGNVRAGVPNTPVLPSYNQLFREDGSRLADEGEDLPQYSGPRGRLPHCGSVIGSSIDAASDGSALQVAHDATLAANTSSSIESAHATASRLRPGDVDEPRESLTALHDELNRIAPVKVVDESIPPDARGELDREQQRQELVELHRDITSRLHAPQDTMLCISGSGTRERCERSDSDIEGSASSGERPFHTPRSDDGSPAQADYFEHTTAPERDAGLQGASRTSVSTQRV